MSNIFKDQNGIIRCKWSGITPEFIDYHDKEWGFPVKDDLRLFEKICLESFQSGLSWRTILAKRDSFREAFVSFDFNKIAKFTQKDVNRLLKDASIVRHKGKIEATINNAKMAQNAVKEFGSLAAFFWSYENLCQDSTQLSKQLSKDLKKLGWKFVGPTTVYAFIQAMGLINDHDKKCIIHSKVQKARKKFKI